ncbi:glycosyltransferase 87 family protein [Hamadaea tsunoensis]|uniref:glycosyltransferase 87 family protein n=1 Tax=Hamadaea tsunoensis TaxID=53368 RepID=UPI00040D68D6|nr:glycosyltransferase 87 family protein [Hamadaea tsunoensis]
MLMSTLIRRLATVAVALVAGWFAWRWLFHPQHLFDLRIYISAEKFWLAGHELYDYAQPDALQGSLYFTYPPFAALLLAPLGMLPLGASFAVVTLGTIACVGLTTWWVTAPLARRLSIPRWYALGLALPVVFLIEPIRTTLAFGQINMFLVALILLDLLVLVPRGSRFAGIGIGLATAIKLTPGLFIVYLLVTRRFREAAVAAGTAAGATLLAALVAPNASRDFWLSALWDTSRVGRTDYTANQSINGLLSRLAAPDAPDQKLWLGLALVVTVLGLWRAAIAVRAGDELTGLAIAGLTAGLISPITWVHHMYWFVPAIAALVLAMVGGDPARRLWLGAGALATWLIAVYGVDTFIDWGVAQRPTPGMREFLLRNALVLLSLVLVMLIPVGESLLPRRTRTEEQVTDEHQVEVHGESEDRPGSGPIVRYVGEA